MATSLWGPPSGSQGQPGLEGRAKAPGRKEGGFLSTHLGPASGSAPGLYGIVDHLIPRFKSPRHYLELYGFLNHFEPLENEALNTPPHGITAGRNMYLRSVVPGTQ